MKTIIYRIFQFFAPDLPLTDMDAFKNKMKKVRSDMADEHHRRHE